MVLHGGSDVQVIDNSGDIGCDDFNQGVLLGLVFLVALVKSGVFLVFLILSPSILVLFLLVVQLDELNEHAEGGILAVFVGVFVAGEGVVNELEDVVALANDVVELLGLNHVLDDAAGIEVVLFGGFRSELLNQLLHHLLLCVLNLLAKGLLEVVVLNTEELVEELGDGLLVDVVEQAVDDIRSGREHVGNQVLLLSVDQECD